MKPWPKNTLNVQGSLFLNEEIADFDLEWPLVKVCGDFLLVGTCSNGQVNYDIVARLVECVVRNRFPIKLRHRLFNLNWVYMPRLINLYVNSGKNVDATGDRRFS